MADFKEILVDGQVYKVKDETARQSSGSGDGTVTGVKVGSTTYEPTEGVVDISPAIPDTSGLATKTEVTQGLAGKVDKVTGYDLSKNDYTDADKAKLAGIETGAEVNVINGIKANGASETLPVENGIVTLPPAASPISPATAAPSMDGSATVGVSDKYAREDHRHPHDTSKQDTLTFDDVPTAGHTTQVMSSDKIKTALDSLLQNLHIVNNEWYIGTTPTGVSAQGPAGNVNITDASDLVTILVNDLTTGGAGNILSAEMGKVLKTAISTLIDSMGEYCFPSGRPTLSWEGAKANIITHFNNSHVTSTNTAQRVDIGAQFETTLGTDNNLYVIDDDTVVVTMGGVTQVGAYSAVTGKVTIGEVTDTVEITANAITYIGYGENNSPLVLMLDGKNQGSTANQWENLCDTNKPLVLSGGYTKSSDHVAFDGVDGNGVIDQLNINMPYKTTSVETVFSSASMPPTTNSILLINNYAENTLMLFGTGSGIYANRLLLDACTKYYQEETASGYTSPLLDTGAGNYMFSANQVVRLCRYGQQFNLNNNTLVNTNENEGLRINVGKDASVLGDFSVSGFISRQGTYFGPFNGSLYCARVYNRILTDNEKAQNYKVDQKRFNLA